MNQRLSNALTELVDFITLLLKGVVLGLSIALAIVVTVANVAESAEGDYCLGEWSQETGVYCQRVAVTSTALAMDRKVGMSIYGALGQVEGLSKAWGVPKRLLNATIEVLWSEEHINPKILNPMQFGANMEGQCIDHYDVIVKWE